MRTLPAAIVLLALTGCMCRPGVLDCTTNRAYPGFCKPLCGGPCDPFMWLAGDCSSCCCCCLSDGYTPYGGRTHCGNEMVYSPSCVAPPLRWASPAVPAAPSGHVVHSPPGADCPPGFVPPRAIQPQSVALPPSAPPAEPDRPPPQAGPAPPYEPLEVEPEVFTPPKILHDARNDRPERSRR